MEPINDYIKHQRPFESLLHAKGYNDRFELISKTTDFHYFGTLKEALHHFLVHMARGNISRTEISLKTYAEYISADDYKECQFIGSFEADKGFNITRLFIESKNPNESQQLKLRNNQDIPGKNAIVGRFRKLRQWERQIKPDYKFKRGR